MPHPKGGYHLASGERVPGTTTIIGRFKDAGGLIHWGWQCGMDGVDYREVRDSAGAAGTLAHLFVEQHISGASDKDIKEQGKLSAPDEATFDKAFNAYGAYLKWQEQSRIEIVAQEISLVSEVYKFGGTPDAIGKSNGQLCLLDWKSGSVYTEALLQCAAYKILWEEAHADQPLTGGFHVCRFSKTDADFTHRFFDDLSMAKEQFLLFRQAYENDKILKKRIA